MKLAKFRFWTVVTVLSLGGIGRLVAPTQAQEGMSGDWSSHNLDLHNTRYSPLDQINTSNASGLTQQWSIETGGADALAQVTPLVVDGVMYFNAGSKLFAVNAATGASLWTYQVDPPFLASAAVRHTVMVGSMRTERMCSTPSTPRPDSPCNPSAPRDGSSSPTQPSSSNTGEGSRPATRWRRRPTYLNGMLYVGLAVSESHIPGGLIAAIDGRTGAVKWVFNTIPQKPTDDGWEITRDSWIGGQRAGGGMWTQPAIERNWG